MVPIDIEASTACLVPAVTIHALTTSLFDVCFGLTSPYGIRAPRILPDSKIFAESDNVGVSSAELAATLASQVDASALQHFSPPGMPGANLGGLNALCGKAVIDGPQVWIYARVLVFETVADTVRVLFCLRQVSNIERLISVVTGGVSLVEGKWYAECTVLKHTTEEVRNVAPSCLGVQTK